ncbi:hypothetical protein [Mameliella alba]|uniref:hypothetical protein n=1 Tax=Mameliella alba TaxID=561184 RepID=UPI0010563D99|nr:hypothetical protein [Mameliella alba]
MDDTDLEATGFKVAVFEPDLDWEDYSGDIEEFANIFEPLERYNLTILRDRRTQAIFIECHIPADKLVEHGTTDVALDTENSSEYRANRDLVTDHASFEQMCSDAYEGRRFSNIVAEYTPGERPLKIIGGQHRFKAIEEALEAGVNTQHGVKVYFQLDNEQRLDVQVISNTNISVSKELLDRMFETIAGAELREWAQDCGLLEEGQDFADKPGRSNPLTVKECRTFIVNYFLGSSIKDTDFEHVDTTPQLVESGKREPKLWGQVKRQHPELWSDEKLRAAGAAFAKLRTNQLNAFYDAKTKKYKGAPDARHKAKNLALLAGWAFVAGCLKDNNTRLARHFSLSEAGKSKDPLRAEILASGRHATDPANYRGLGMRTDAKERGRFAELFWLQAEKGQGISKPAVDLAIQTYEAKQASLRAKAMRAKLG